MTLRVAGTAPKRKPVIQRADGYRLAWAPEHPSAHRGYVYEHRLVAEEKIGRPLRSDELVHHENEDPSDNRPANLRVVTKAWHQRHHQGKCPLDDAQVEQLILAGWTYRRLAAIGVWQHRVRRLKRGLSNLDVEQAAA